jgi:molybdopterin converting factor small subunit
MRVTVKLYASLGEFLPAGAKERAAVLEVGDGTTIARIIRQLNVPPERAHLVLVNGVYVKPEDRGSTRLTDGDTLAMWPPVAGG